MDDSKAVGLLNAVKYFIETVLCFQWFSVMRIAFDQVLVVPGTTKTRNAPPKKQP